MRNGDMLAHITEDDDHEGEADAQADGFDDAVEFIAGEEFEITTHNFLGVFFVTKLAKPTKQLLARKVANRLLPGVAAASSCEPLTVFPSIFKRFCIVLQVL